MPLGVIVQQVMRARGTHWAVAAAVTGGSDCREQDSHFQKGAKIGGKVARPWGARLQVEH